MFHDTHKKVNTSFMHLLKVYIKVSANFCNKTLRKTRIVTLTPFIIMILSKH